MLRHGEVSNEYRCRVALTDHPCIRRWMRSLDIQYFGAQALQQLECAISRLGDSIEIQQPEPTVKQDGRKRVLRENVTEGPKAAALNQSARFPVAFVRPKVRPVYATIPHM